MPGSSFTITGTNFIKLNNSVTINNINCPITSVTPTTITCTVPTITSATNTLDVSGLLTNQNLTINPNTFNFTYLLPTPTITSISPLNVTEGTIVSVRGTNFINGGTTNSITTTTFNSETDISFTMPFLFSGTSNSVPLVLTNAGNANTVSINLNYTAPEATVSSITSTSGISGINVTLSGTKFTEQSKVLFNNNNITPTSVTNSGTLAFTIPHMPDSAGIYFVNVKNNITNPIISQNTTFTYTDQLTLSSASPLLIQNGIPANIILTGTNFINGAILDISSSFFNQPFTASVLSNTMISFTIPSTIFKDKPFTTYPMKITVTNNITGNNLLVYNTFIFTYAEVVSNTIRFRGQITIPPNLIGGMFTNNTRYYVPHTLSTSTNGSGTRNSRVTRRRT